MHTFDQDISLTRERPFCFSATIAPNWGVNGIANGGYLTAIMANAMIQAGGHKLAPIVTVNFISRCIPGKADILVEKIAGSKQFDRFQASLNQEGVERLRVFGTFSKTEATTGGRRYETGPPQLADLADCVPIPPVPEYTLYDQLDIRLDPECTGWMTGNTNNPKSEHKGWARFKAERPLDFLSILLIADTFPPPVISSQGLVAWVPTLEYSVNTRNLPKGDWLRCSFRTRFINNGLLEEDGELWDESGELVAISRQIAQYKPIDNSK